MSEAEKELKSISMETVCRELIGERPMYRADQWDWQADGIFKGFAAGYKACHAKMLEQASEGFEEWMESRDSINLSFIECAQQRRSAWTAAKLSAFRDVKFTNEQFLALEQKFAKAINKLEFYGSRESWFPIPNMQGTEMVIDHTDEERIELGPNESVYSGGRRAREALKEVRGEK